MKDSFDFAALVRAGYRFAHTGRDVEVQHPDGRFGHGATEEDAVQNIGAQILPVSRPDYVGRVLLRADGSEVKLDVAGHREVPDGL